MTPFELAESAVHFLPFALTNLQLTLLNSLSSFVLSHGPRDIFLLNGYAGTGKTSVIGALVKAMAENKIKTVLLAPTGRAAKVMSSLSGREASTIHKRIFRGNSLDPSNNQFFLSENKDKDTIFIVDEASLITDSEYFNKSLLQQLVHYVYSSPGCAIILVGDTAQLPPIGMTESPAMNTERISRLSLNPIQFTLDTPLRQSAKSGILFNATAIRKAMSMKLKINRFLLFQKKFKDVEFITFNDIEEKINESWGEVGMDETLIITRSNKRANQFNSSLRQNIMYAEQPLEIGERLIISKNDYFWSKINQTKGFIANGESAEILWLGKPEKKYGRWFMDVELKLQNSDQPFQAKILLRSLVSESPSVAKEEMERFYNLVMANYEGEISFKIKGALEDPYYNALQVKYAYCVTCHKAQGGQWKHVYIDMGGLNVEEGMEIDFYRWIYTAVTRSTEKVFFVNSSLRIK